MSSFEPNKEHLGHILRFLFNQKKNAMDAVVYLWKFTVTTQNAQNHGLFQELKNESLRKEDNAVHLVESEGCHVP